jgi:hypothetical protein
MDPKLASFGAQTKSDEKINEQLKDPGADPATLSYNASGVKIYNPMSSLVRFENKNISFFKKVKPTKTPALYIGRRIGSRFRFLKRLWRSRKEVECS